MVNNSRWNMELNSVICIWNVNRILEKPVGRLMTIVMMSKE